MQVRNMIRVSLLSTSVLNTINLSLTLEKLFSFFNRKKDLVDEHNMHFYYQKVEALACSQSIIL